MATNPKDEEEKRKRGNYGDAAAAALDADVTQPKYGKPGDFPVNPDGTPMQKMGFDPGAAPVQATADGGAAFGVPPSMGRRPTQVAKAPDQSQVPATQRLGWRTDSVMNEAAGDAQAAFSKGNYGETAGTLVRGAAAAVPAAFVDFGEGLAGGIVPAVKGFYRGMTGGDAITDPPASALKPVVGATAAQAAPKPVVPAQAAAPAPVVAPTAATESAPDGSPLGKDVGYGIRRIDAPGKSPLFTNVGNADNAALMGRSGAVSAQNQNAAQILSDRYAGEARNAAAVDQYNHEVAAAQAINARPIAKDTGGFGLLSKEYQDRRNASFAPSSLQGDTARNAYVLAQNKALDDQSLENVKSDRDEARVSARERGATDRAILQEQGVNSRFGMSNKIAQQKADAEQAKLGFDTKAASQIQALQQQIVSETDPKKLAVLQDKMQTLTGKHRRPEPANKFTVVPGGQAVDPKTGQTYTVPSRVLDNQTKRFVDQPSGSGSEQSPYKDGQELVGKDGKIYIVTNGQPVLKK